MAAIALPVISFTPFHPLGYPHTMSIVRFHLPLNGQLVALAASALVFTACSSRNEAAPQTGAVQGVAGPPGAATLATATNNQGQAFTTVPDRRTGAYALSDLPAGPYTVRFTAAPEFTALSSATPLVLPSQTVAAGTTFMTYTTAAASIHGLVTWQYDGKFCSHQQLAGSLSADSLRIVALSCTPDGTDVVLRVKPFAGVGTYSLGSGNASAVFRRYLPASIASYAATGTSGTLTVTRYEAATRTLVGTFSFTANALAPATGTAAVTGGTIDLRL